MSKKFNEIFSTFTRENSVSCHTIPPRAPQFVGLWEAAVKPLKRHFFRRIGETRLPLHHFLILTHIEAILNSRPLVSPSKEVNVAIALTPGHFFIGWLSRAMPSSKRDKNIAPPTHQSPWQHSSNIFEMVERIIFGFSGAKSKLRTLLSSKRTASRLWYVLYTIIIMNYSIM